MQTVGIDIGSRTIEIVLLKEKQIVSMHKFETQINLLEQVKTLLATYDSNIIVATGYGRQLVQNYYNCKIITEIKAYATAIKFLYPDAKLILDIGGQDTKIISLDSEGNIKKFEMNDKCAAGTGKFLEIMAMTIGVGIEEFGMMAENVNGNLMINNTCTVFAESEVVSLITQGYSKDLIAHAIHQTVAHKAVSMINRLAGNESTIIFAGGVALNKTIVKLIKKISNKNIIVPDSPQYLGALGAALLL